MSKTKIRIKLKAFEHKSLDKACAKIVETVKRNGGTVVGPVPLPTEIEKITILRLFTTLMLRVSRRHCEVSTLFCAKG